MKYKETEQTVIIWIAKQGARKTNQPLIKKKHFYKTFEASKTNNLYFNNQNNKR